MNFYDQLEWQYWKKMTDEEKAQLFQKVVMYFVSPLAEIEDIRLIDHELAGIKCRTFECKIDQEDFVFIPGNKSAILGWDTGTSGVHLTDLSFTLSEDLEEPYATWKKEYSLTTLADYDRLINQHTTDLRNAAIPSMLVQKKAIPVNTKQIGCYHAITGEFTGEIDQFTIYSTEVRDSLCPQLSPEESLTWAFPERIFKKNCFYLEMIPDTDTYAVYLHQEQSFSEMITNLQKQNIDLLSVDQWEYIVGAGTRRLFRWGKEIRVDHTYWGRKVCQQIAGPNMFGLVIDCSKERIELINDPYEYKLMQAPKEQQAFLNAFPLATYFKNPIREEPFVTLDPTIQLYRKAILIED